MPAPIPFMSCNDSSFLLTFALCVADHRAVDNLSRSIDQRRQHEHHAWNPSVAAHYNHSAVHEGADDLHTPLVSTPPQTVK
jgi:hypothetical protein